MYIESWTSFLTVYLEFTPRNCLPPNGDEAIAVKKAANNNNDIVVVGLAPNSRVSELGLERMGTWKPNFLERYLSRTHAQSIVYRSSSEWITRPTWCSIEWITRPMWCSTTHAEHHRARAYTDDVHRRISTYQRWRPLRPTPCCGNNSPPWVPRRIGIDLEFSPPECGECAQTGGRWNE